MTYEELVKKVKDAAEGADVSKTGNAAFQFNVEGEAAGAFYLAIKDGKADVQPYEYHDRDVLITCNAQTLADIAGRKLDPVKAYTLHKIKVDGDLGKALLLKDVLGKKK